MGQLEDLNVFTTVVENNSISKAAEKLNVAKSAISRRINLLEERYGTRLIDREPGVWQVTATGQELYQRATRVVTDMEEIESDFREERQNLTGPLSISMPRDFGIAFLTPQLIAFKQAYPDIQLTVDFDDRKVDLSRENYDFAMRIGSTVEDRHAAQRIGSSVLRLCASPAYLKKKGNPKSIEDLANHDLIHFGTARRAVWKFGESSGKPQCVEFQPILNSNNGDFLVAATAQGLGISHAPDFLSQKLLKDGKLQLIGLKNTDRKLGIHLIHSEDRRMNRRMRLFAKEMQSACLSSELLGKTDFV